MNARECIMGRRSIRAYTDQPVSREFDTSFLHHIAKILYLSQLWLIFLSNF